MRSFQNVKYQKLFIQETYFWPTDIFLYETCNGAYTGVESDVVQTR